MLKLKKVHKKINGVMIIDSFTAAFPSGIISALVGPNGAGKTSLFHLITGEMQPDAGSIIYNQGELNQLPAHEIARRGVGRLFQDVRIFTNLTVLENIITACYSSELESPWFPFLHPSRMKQKMKENAAQAEFILERFALIKLKDSVAGELSFGQQKLLAIGRLLAADCSLLLFDEPTAGLNPVMIRKILEVMQAIIDEDNSKTIVIVEHNMNVVADIAQWVCFMNEGRLAFTGRTDHVLGCKEVRETFLGLGGER